MPASKVYLYKKGKKNIYLKNRKPFSRRQVKAISKIAQRSGEKKTYEQAMDNSNLYSSGGSSLQCIPMIQGDGNQQRVGDTIKVDKLVWRGYIHADGSLPVLARLLVIQVVSPSTGAGFTSIRPDSFLPDMESTNTSYKVLADKIISAHPNGKELQFFKIKVKGKRLKSSEYDSGATTLARGNIMCFVATNEGLTTGNAELFSNVKVFYHDS
jgi:hypothetical protein